MPPPDDRARGASGRERDAARAWLGFAGFYAASFAVLAAYMQFFPVWLQEVRGFDAQDIAVILAALPIARTIAGPLWSQRVDRTGDARAALLLLTVAACGAFAAFAAAHTLWFAWCVSFALGCLFPPVQPIVDAAAVRSADRHGYSFGRLRLVGSLSFLLVAVLAGSLLDRAASDTVYWLLLGLFAATAASALLVPGRGSAPASTSGARPSMLRLLRSPPFVLLLFGTALIQGSHAAYYNLSTLHWNAHGISKATAGVLWAEGVLAEVVLLFFARQTLDRLRPTTLLLLGALAAAVRWAVLATTVSVPLLLLVNWLHAFSFAATYLGAIRAVERRVPLGQRATAQGLVGAASSGFGMVVCGLVGGAVYDIAEAAAWWWMAAIALLGGVIALVLRRSVGGRAAAVSGDADG